MAAIMLLSVAAVGGVGAWLAVRGTRARIESQIREVARLVEESNFPLTSAVLRQMRALSGAELLVVDGTGRVTASSTAISTTTISRRVSPLMNRSQVSWQDRVRLVGLSYFHMVVPLALERSGDKSRLHILYPEEEYRRAWQRAVYPPLAFVAVAMPVVMLLALVTGSQIGGRVGRLRQQVDRIACGEFQQFELPDGDDEIRALAVAVNRMASMLADYAEEVRRTERMRTLAHLGGGIAHQLRNSATGCAMAVDLHAAECPLSAAAESLSVAKQQLRLMEQYLQRFLQLGKPSESAAHAAVDVAVLVDELLPLVEPAARHAGVTLDWERGTEPAVVHGDAERLGQLVINLLINAIEAASAGRVQSSRPALVRIELLRPAADQLALSISDSGLGPADRVRENLFEPFVTEKPDGVGLGLSVAREVAQQHGGRIDWRRADGMTCFTLELPCETTEKCGVEAVGCR
jgi:signal transduction histidine kinase